MPDIYQVRVTKIVALTPATLGAGSTGDVFSLEATEGWLAEKEAAAKYGHLLPVQETMAEWTETPVGSTCLVVLRNGVPFAECYSRQLGKWTGGGEFEWTLLLNN